MPMHVWPSARQRLRHRLDALAAVAPGRVHLKIAAEVPLRHDGRVARQRQRLLHRELAEEVGAQLPQRRDLVGVSRRGHRRIDRRRGAGFHELDDDAGARRADVGHVAQRARLPPGRRPAAAARSRPSPRACSRVASARCPAGRPCRGAGRRRSCSVGRRLDLLGGSPFSPALPVLECVAKFTLPVAAPARAG